MSIKNAMLDIRTTNVHVSNARNNVSKVVCMILSIIFLIISLFAFFFNWVVGLVFLGLSALFFGFSRLAKFATKFNQKTIRKMQEMKDQNPNERI